jgi:hypothetical protein
MSTFGCTDAVQKRLMQDFNLALSDVQKQQESRIKLGGAAAQLAKERRKDVIALIKVCLQQQPQTHSCSTSQRL